MGKKKKGSTLIIAIMAIGFLTMMGAVVLAVSLSDQKLRLQESTNTKNLYSSESGIEVAYKILEGVVKDAVDEGNKSVNELKNEINNEINKAEVDERNNAYNSLFKARYSEYIENKLKSRIQNGDYSIAMIDSDVPKVEVSNLSKNEKEALYNVQLTSTFTTTKVNSKGSKVINVRYNIKVPDYNRIVKVAESKDSTIPQYNIINNIITCDGNLKLNNEGSVGFYGNIWAKGKPKNQGEILNPAYDKYVGGIDFTGNGGASIYGEIMTASTFRANQKYGLIIDGNSAEGKLYAGNFYVGKENQGDADLSIYENRRVDAGRSSVYLSNDLCINYSRTNLTLGNFYGLNDKNTVENGVRYRNSSAIIINTMDVGAEEGKTKLTVNNEAYLMGTAYINTSPDYYQTGESVGVKGNYKAYTNQISDSEFKDAIFEYKAPLQLITKFSNGDPLALNDKIDYIDLYNKDNKNELNKNGIAFNGSVKSIGTYFDSKGNLVKGKPLEANDLDKLYKMREEFASKVLMMGSKATLKDFEDGQVKKRVENQFNWDSMKNIVDKRGNVIDHNLILNADESKEVVIEATKDNVKVKLGDKEIKNYTGIYNNAVFLVITKGNVRYEVNEARHSLTCSVIAKGDVTVNVNSGVTSIGNYDNSANPIVTNGVNEIIKKHFNDVFKNIFSKEVATNSSVNIANETEYEVENPSSVKDLIVKERWKLEK